AGPAALGRTRPGSGAAARTDLAARARPTPQGEQPPVGAEHPADPGRAAPRRRRARLHAVTYRHLGVTGRALVLLTLTGLALVAPVPLARRGLTASAEAIGGVGVALALLDAYALRRAGVGNEVEHTSYLAGTTGALSVLL